MRADRFVTEVLPPKIDTFNPPDRKNVDKWANGGFKKNGKKIAQALDDGEEVADADLQASGISPTEE